MRKYQSIVSSYHKGNIIYVNKNFVKIAGYSEAELLNEPHNIIRHPDMPKAAFKIVWTAIQTKGFWQGHVKNLAKTGNFYWVYATILKKINKLGQITYLSIRTKPKKDDVLEAELLYKKLK